MASLVLIKPDAFERKLVGWCLAVFEHFTICEIKRFNSPVDRLYMHYREHSGKDFYEDLMRFMCSGPVLAVAIIDEATLVRAAAMQIRRCNTVRDLVEGPRNLVHASDSEASAKRELNIWFPERL